MSQASFDIKNRIKKETPAEKLISQELKDKAEEVNVQIPGQEDIDNLDGGKFKPESMNKPVENKGKGKNKPEPKKSNPVKENNITPVEPELKEKPIEKPKRKDGARDKRYKNEDEKLNRRFPLNLKPGIFEDLELIATYQKTSINQIINDYIEKCLDQKELDKYREIEKSLRK